MTGAAFVLIVVFSFFTGCTSKSEKGVTIINFVTWQPNRPDVWDEIVHNFEKAYPGIKVKREVGPQSSTAFHDLLTQKLKNQSRETDVFFMDVTWPPEFASAGWALPLDDRFPPAEREKFLKGPITANTYNGKIYGVPVFIDAGMLFYRTDLLKKYGFSPPVTWPEMVSQAEAIVKGEKNQNPDLTGFSGQFKQYEGLVCNMLEYILSRGGQIVGPETGKSALTSKKSIEAVQFVRDQIIGRIASKGVLTYQEPESMDLFAQGKAVFLRNWPYAWEVSNNPETSKIAGKVGVAKLPLFPGGGFYSALGGWQLGVSSFSRHKDAAWKFVEFVAGERTQKLIAVKIGKAPARISLFEDKEILKANPQFAGMKDVFLSAYPRPRTPLYPAVSNILQLYFSKTISDPAVEIVAEARRASAEIDKLLEMAR
jgi:multiple sugar transport system substrate-binding protein